MRELAERALNVARFEGATYADVRVIDSKSEDITVKNGKVATLDRGESQGFGVRVILNGSWGFAASSVPTLDEVERVTRLACAIARASTATKKKNTELAPEPPYQDKWHSTYLIDPFDVPLNEKLGLLMQIDEILRKDPRITVAEGNMSFWREEQLFASSEGSLIEQKILRSGGGYECTAVNKETGEIQRRSYPSSFGGQYMLTGYEIIPSLNLVENAERVREEAIALLTAPQCPSEKRDLILEGSQLALQIHESLGHPSELDRVLGMEANYAGTSFLTTDKLGNFRYGSPLVNIVADGTIPAGLATIGYDDDGVRSQRWHLVKDGVFSGYLTNRELASEIGESRSRGANRADGWRSLPMIRMTNISLVPGNWDLNDLIADTEHGILMETTKSWSIDQRRINFQFACEIGRIIENGKITGIVKNPTYQGITPEFWGSCDAITSEKYWRLWGVTNCGKGQPGQRAEMSHGAAPSRFKNVTIGIAR